MKDIKMPRKKKKQYVDNGEMYGEILDYYKEDAEISEKLHLMFWEMCKKIINRPRFSRYTPEWREDMQSTAYIKCVKIISEKKFDKERTNPFSYFTTVISNCYLDVAHYENKQLDIKRKLTDIVLGATANEVNI